MICEDRGCVPEKSITALPKEASTVDPDHLERAPLVVPRKEQMRAPYYSPPREAQPEKKGRLWIGGLVTWAVAYTVGVAATSALADPLVRDLSVSYMAIPLVGPFILMSSDLVDTTGYTGTLVVGGCVQALGLVLVLVGVAGGRKSYVQVATLGKNEDSPVLSLVPTSDGKGGPGLALSLDLP